MPSLKTISFLWPFPSRPPQRQPLARETGYQTRLAAIRNAATAIMVNDKDAFCCVYDLTPPVETSSASTATSSTDDYAGWSTAGECFTKVPFSASNYSDLVSSASSKIAATRATVASNQATSTSISSSSVSVSSGPTSATSGTGSKTSSGSAASTSNAAMPIATAQEMMLGGAAVVGLFVL